MINLLNEWQIKCEYETLNKTSGGSHMNKTKERAKEILNLYLDEVKDFDFVKSVILVGSLSDNTYTGNAGSDIDLIHIVADEIDYSFEKKQIFDLISKVEQATERDVPISMVVFQSRHLVHPYNYDFELTQENKDLLERPIEVFRALDSGITVYGEDLIKTLERPTRADVEMTKRMNNEQMNALKDTDWYKNEYLKIAYHPSIRMMTQMVLTTAMSEYYYYTGKSCSSKYYILERVEKECPQITYLNLLRLCHKNRFSPDEITEQDIETMNKEYQTCYLKRPKTWNK